MNKDTPGFTMEKISAWLNYQEEVFGKFQVRDFKTSQDNRTGHPAVDPAENESASIQESEQTVTMNTPGVIVSDSGIRDHTAEEIPVSAATPTYPGPDPYHGLSECHDLDALRIICEYAAILKTDLENTNLVFGTGNPRADLLIIGEAPGEQEDLKGEPFVGKAGQLLNKILKAIGFERDQVYIANILKHRPPKNRDPLPEERSKSLPFLEKQIDLIHPKLILCLGRISAQTLLGTTAPMKELRGSFHLYKDKYELMVTYHPAALLRNPGWKRHTWEDVQILRKRYDELAGIP
jgi:uracil-DNA glycosylase